MADECDYAQQYQDFQTNLAIKQALATGLAREHKFCLNCLEPSQGSAFCDKDCREDYERRTRR